MNERKTKRKEEEENHKFCIINQNALHFPYE